MNRSLINSKTYRKALKYGIVEGYKEMRDNMKSVTVRELIKNIHLKSIYGEGVS